MLNNKDYEIYPVFPEAFIYYKIIDIDSNKIIDYCKNLNFEFTESSIKKESDCYISSNFNIFNDLSELKDKIEEHIKNYLYKVMEYKLDYKFINSWATKTNLNGFSQAHVHSNTFLTGVFYPKGNENFRIKFHKNNKSFWEIDVKNCNQFNSKTMTYVIEKDNTLLLFPSNLLHSIGNNNSNIDRYSIAFNINPKGYIGNQDSKVFF